MPAEAAIASHLDVHVLQDVENVPVVLGRCVVAVPEVEIIQAVDEDDHVGHISIAQLVLKVRHLL